MRSTKSVISSNVVSHRQKWKQRYRKKREREAEKRKQTKRVRLIKTERQEDK